MTQKMKVTFGGEELSKYLYVTDGLDRGVIGDRTNTTVKIGHSTGEKLIDTTLGMRTITMPFYINQNVPNALVEIARIINTTETKQLIFGDEPDWYYDAIVDGSTTFTRLEQEGNGVITFKVPDMYKKKTTLTTVKSNGRQEFEFINAGTAETPVTITAKMNGDNGYIGYALNGRYYQVGKPQEVNGHFYDKSEMLVAGDPMPNASKYTLNKPNFQVIPPLQGKLTQMGTVKDDPKNGHILPATFGDVTTVIPHGPSITYEIPADSFGNKGSKNFTFRWHAGFGNFVNDFGKVGQICATIHDKDGKAMASIAYNDLTQQKTEYNVRYDLNGEKILESNIYDHPNGFTEHAYIIKSGANFTFRWNYFDAKTITCDALKDTEAYYVSFSFMQWYNIPVVPYFGLVNWNFKKTMTDLYADDPNFFSNGDIAILDSETNEFTINNFADWDTVDIGSRPMVANIGKNLFGFVWSDWAKMPEITLTYRERRL